MVPDAREACVISYSQHDEQDVLDRLIRSWPPRARGNKARRFLDIGAYDGIRYSNTHFLARMGWSGVCVEPSFEPFARLARLYRDNPRIVLVHALIGLEPRLVKFWSSPDAVSTTDPAHHAKWKNAASFQEIWIPQLSVDQFLLQFPGPFDMLNIDCEGDATESIYTDLAARDFAGARVVCVEWNSSASLKTRMVRAASQRGMTLQHTTPHNLILSR